MELPNEDKVVFKTSVGYHPNAREWDSDSVRVKIEIKNQQSRDVLFDRYILPKADYHQVRASIPDRYLGKHCQITFYLFNENNN